MITPPTPEQINILLNEYLANEHDSLGSNAIKSPRLTLLSLDPGTFPNSLIITFGIPSKEDPKQPSQEVKKTAQRCLDRLFAVYPGARSYHLTIEYAQWVL